MTAKQQSATDFDRTVDTSGTQCPYPVAAARRALATMAAGERLLLISTDRGTALDIEAFCARTGHKLQSSQATELPFKFVVIAAN